ncbi:RHS repeat-associated core domain-containing protein [Pantoea sp. Ap-967]|uniref:RHS repeat-associated core domain-containing protein n=1 Tax=Pantoea sp. Ap-967 TaxID=2608362 RepID=UPI00141E2A4F|nr:RHS repeat-associated core domain-containing protein [Pantoea sp. Ap-967]NIE74025.1 RHS repeat-associated core domain-containing protein [Pantoea sp. Ap-967]
MLRKLFYQHERLALIAQVLQQRRLMGSEVQTHAVLVNTAQTKPVVLLACDTLRSVLQSDSQCEVLLHRYTPYGHQPPQPTLPGFTGQVAEPVTGGYLLGNGYRLYSPSLMRFIAPDSWSPFAKAGINPYAYCKGDPINNCDPSGHIKSPIKLFNTAANRAVKVVAYEYVKATKGQGILNKVMALGDPAKRPRGIELSAAEAKVGKRIVTDELKFAHESYNALAKESLAPLGGKIIFDESESYTGLIIENKMHSLSVRISRLESARDYLSKGTGAPTRESKEIRV